MSALTDLAGHLTLKPGSPAPENLRNSRRDWASRLGQGKPADKLPDLMAGLFNLCGQSHRLCSRMAVSAAQGHELPEHSAVLLATETATEHVRRIGLDWPRLLPGLDLQTGVSAPAELAVQATASLQTCPLLHATRAAYPNERWVGMTAWLEGHCFHMPIQEWLTDWNREGTDSLYRWSHARVGWLPRLIRAAFRWELALPLPRSNALLPHANESALRCWAQTWVNDDTFALRPQWQGTWAHTGSWTRARAPTCGAYTTTTLLGSRLAELARLCMSFVDGYEPLVLSYGAVKMGENHGLAWVEMARGLLVHQLVLEGSKHDSRASVYRVVAPTEWNFHPQGAVASVLASLCGQNDGALAQRVGQLMAAFDPCVPYQI